MLKKFCVIPCDTHIVRPHFQIKMPSHTASREKVCALCWNRRGKKVERVIKEGSQIEQALDEYVVPGYKASSLHAPCGICVDCRIRLMEHANKKPNPRKLTIPVGFVLGEISVEDIEGRPCSCHICFLGGLSGGALKAYISSLSTADEVEPMSDLRRCNFCFEAIIGSQSASHSCGGKAAILENLKKALTPKTGTQLALEILKDKVEQGGQSVVQLQSHKGGKPTEVTVGKQKTSHVSVLTGENAKVIQVRQNLNQTQMKHFLADYRTLNGRHSVEPYIVENMLQSKKELEGFFSVELVNFLAKILDNPIDYDLDPQPMVYCHDLEGLLCHIAAERKVEVTDLLKLIGLDRGQGHVQLTLQPHQESDTLPQDVKAPRRRRRRSDGLSRQDKAAFGVNNLIILAASPVKSENYLNLDIFLEKTQLREVCLKFCGDLKVFNEITGIQTCTSTFPCYACEARRDPKTGNWEGVPAPLRTYARNEANYNEWLAGGGGVMGGVAGLKLLKNHKNVSSLPLLGKCEPEKPLLQILVPPALHIKLGVVNDALEQLDKRWEGLETWLGGRGISYVPYHGCVLEGKECSQVLDDVDSLEESLPDHLKTFSSYLRAFRAVMVSTCGIAPGPSWEQDIADFKTQFLAAQQLFGLKETPKIHIILQHIPDFIR